MKKYAEYNNYLQEFPDSNGYYGEYGGAILPDELIPVFKEISEAYEDMSSRPHYYRELSYIREHFQGRPTPVYHCERLYNLCGKYQIYYFFDAR